MLPGGATSQSSGSCYYMGQTLHIRVRHICTKSKVVPSRLTVHGLSPGKCRAHESESHTARGWARKRGHKEAAALLRREQLKRRKIRYAASIQGTAAAAGELDLSKYLPNRQELKGWLREHKRKWLQARFETEGLVLRSMPHQWGDGLMMQSWLRRQKERWRMSSGTYEAEEMISTVFGWQDIPAPHWLSAQRLLWRMQRGDLMHQPEKKAVQNVQMFQIRSDCRLSNELPPIPVSAASGDVSETWVDAGDVRVTCVVIEAEAAWDEPAWSNALAGAREQELSREETLQILQLLVALSFN